MTNSERKRRHISEVDFCQVYKGEVEIIMHVLRECSAMAGIWHWLVPISKRQSFFETILLEWLYANLCEGVETVNGVWSTVFVMAVLWGWK